MESKSSVSKNVLKRKLNCLYQLSELVENNFPEKEKVLAGFVKIIPPAMHNPEKIHVMLELEGKTYRSDKGGHYNYKREIKISTEKQSEGLLTLYSNKKKTSSKDAGFSNNEIIFVNYLCERIGRVIQRYNLAEQLKSAQIKLETQNTILEKKNIALSEILNHLESEKEKSKKNIQNNIDTVILPILDNMKSSSNPTVYIDALYMMFKEITSDFGYRLKNNYSQLSPREVEICTHLKNGKTSKEIGEILSVSAQTINKHREHIREKLGLNNKKVNLITFLNSE